MFKPTAYVEVPTTDVLTWTFGNRDYDLDKPIYVDTEQPERVISYNEARSIVRKLIAGFKSHGLQAGDPVCLHSSNSIYYALIFLAIVGAGGIFVGSNPHYTAHELAHLFSLSKVKYIIAEEDYLKNIQIAAHIENISSDNIFVFDHPIIGSVTNPQNWASLLQLGEEDWVQFDDASRAKSVVASLMMTSGTTGMPKVAQSSHYAQIAGCTAIYGDTQPYEVSRLICLPQFHAFAGPISILLPLRAGHRTYIMRRYRPDTFMDNLAKYQPTDCAMVNPIIYKFMHRPPTERLAAHCLRSVLCGGVPLEKSVQNQFQQMLHPDAIVSQVYGMTEVGWAFGLKHPERDDTGSAGRLLPNVEARIIDESGRDILEDNQPGQIILRAPSIMNGYLDNEQATAGAIVNGWLHTGDIGYQQSGKWYIIDRLKELIKVRGWQVSPVEIEKCLLSHPGVLDAAVIGVDLKDERGELPRAYLIVDPTSNTTDGDIHQFVRERLSRYKALDGGIRRVDTLPRNSIGKVLKAVLREEAKLEVHESEQEQTRVAHNSQHEAAESGEQTRSRPKVMELRDDDLHKEDDVEVHKLVKSNS